MPKRSTRQNSFDIDEMASAIVEAASQKEPVSKPVKKKDPEVLVLANLGRFKGAKIKAEVLTKEQLSEMASLAGQARWAKHHYNAGKNKNDGAPV
ncbi:MAG: hypothetical protein HY202_06845 [Nitrospirae bacterium]|nr:hypothetical protein [Nitrospirota bacterium]MBI3605724.1 hypothetical protein [Nitrospirota bacterium]